MHENEKDALEYVLSDFLSCVRERKEEAEQIVLSQNADDFEKGRHLAYAEMLEMLESRCRIYDVTID